MWRNADGFARDDGGGSPGVHFCHACTLARVARIGAHMVKGSRSGRVWARGIDRMIASNRYIVLLGDIDAPTPNEMREALAALATAGPHTRVALTPIHSERFWRYQPCAPVPVHEVPATVAESGIAAVLHHVRHRPGPRRPLEVTVTDRHIAVESDHGLGDVALMHYLFAAILALVDGRTTPFVTRRDTSLALPRALLHTFVRHPSQLRRTVRYAKSIQTEPGGAEDPGGAERAWTPSIAVSLACPDVAAVAAVDGWRRAQTTPIGAGSAWLFIAQRALLEAGLPLRDRSMVAFNCRRYLPSGRTVYSNFGVGLEVPLPVDGSVAELAGHVRTMTESAVPLAALGALSARLLASSGSPESAPADEMITDLPARLMYSDLGRMSDLDGAPWRTDGTRAFAGNVQPDSPHDVSIFTASVSAHRNVSFSYHDNVFDRSILDRAAQLITADPLRFLEAG
ncbi:hypothetical protein O6P37_10395 [Mycobacterium sp. CPCC 205372]|uniref:Acyltransferase PapA5 n=1 Tax=Mycobacterium hippophais TaxID=3016340 RepID=A0ABT4PRT4_9MYCO|nr:hypothetical protein [Mycobacterium hippophais]MCZ8379273.1 hypothetical protein [Mycobacterium hippophais]